jgi:hypothetical protein
MRGGRVLPAFLSRGLRRRIKRARSLGHCRSSGKRDGDAGPGSLVRLTRVRMRPSDFFHGNVVLSFQEDAIGIRLRDVIGVDNMMWGSDYPHSASTFPRSRTILAGVPHDEQAKIWASTLPACTTLT